MTTLEAPKAIWVRLLRDLADLSFQSIPRPLSIADLDAPLGRLRKSPLRVFVEELIPEAVTVSE